MELKEFIRETLVEIIDGIKAAQSEIEKGEVVGRQQESGHTVDFDVAVTTASSTSGGGKISVWGSGGGLEGSSSSEAVTRIKFTVPVNYPRKGA